MFASVITYGRWSLTKGGRAWRFDCIYIIELVKYMILFVDLILLQVLS